MAPSTSCCHAHSGQSRHDAEGSAGAVTYEASEWLEPSDAAEPADEGPTAERGAARV
jgi:hypothetical protein